MLSPEQILILKTGVIGGVPNDFWPNLAHQQDAKVHDPSIIKEELAVEMPQINPYHRAELARAATVRQAITSLRAGQNVFFDGFLNQRSKRDDVRGAVSAEVGIQIVHLVSNAPDHIRRQRIAEKKGCDPAGPLSREAEKLYRSSVNMHGRTEFPDKDEPHLRLDGTKETPALLEDVATYISSLFRPVPTLG